MKLFSRSLSFSSIFDRMLEISFLYFYWMLILRLWSSNESQSLTGPKRNKINENDPSRESNLFVLCTHIDHFHVGFQSGINLTDVGNDDGTSELVANRLNWSLFWISSNDESISVGWFSNLADNWVKQYIIEFICQSYIIVFSRRTQQLRGRKTTRLRENEETEDAVEKMKWRRMLAYEMVLSSIYFRSTTSRRPQSLIHINRYGFIKRLEEIQICHW